MAAVLKMKKIDIEALDARLRRLIPALNKRRLPMNVQPYLFFEGRAEEALNFYTKALGTKPTMVMRYRDCARAAAARQGAARQRGQGDARFVSRR